MATYSIVRKLDNTEVYRYTHSEKLYFEAFDEGEYEQLLITEVAITPPAAILVWEPFEFMRRFTPKERQEARLERVTNAELNDFFSLLEMAPLVHSNDLDLNRGLSYLVYLGVITSARKNEILGVI